MRYIIALALLLTPSLSCAQEYNSPWFMVRSYEVSQDLPSTYAVPQGAFLLVGHGVTDEVDRKNREHCNKHGYRYIRLPLGWSRCLDSGLCYHFTWRGSSYFEHDGFGHWMWYAEETYGKQPFKRGSGRSPMTDKRPKRSTSVIRPTNYRVAPRLYRSTPRYFSASPSYSFCPPSG